MSFYRGWRLSWRLVGDFGKGAKDATKGNKGAPMGQKPNERDTKGAKKGFREHFLKRTAEGVILGYIRGIKKRATLNWALGNLRATVGPGKLPLDEIQNISSEIKSNPSLYLLEKFPKRKERLKELERKLKAQ